MPPIDISSTLEKLRSRATTPSALSTFFLDKIDKLNPSINAFSEVIRDGWQSATPEQALYGIPIAIKDLIDVEGHATRAGSPKFFGDLPASEDAFVVKKLKAAGANIIGKTHTHEIALGITGINPHYGPVRNPHSLEYISGGSSSGSAAAIAAGMCLGALGTDTGGSIRIPSSLCGVVGIKPTTGRVSARGVVPLSWNLDHVGPIAATVRDAAILLQIIAGYDALDPASLNVPVDDYLNHLNDGVRGWRVALLSGEDLAASNPGVLEALNNAAKVFTELGAIVTPVEIEILRAASNANLQITLSDAAAFHREHLAEHPDWFGEDVRQRLETGMWSNVTEYSLARRTQTEVKRYFEGFFEAYDILMLPTTASTAVPIEGLKSAEYAPRLTSFTAPFNLAGLPALSIPCGNVDGLPVGLQIVGPAWGEARVLRAGQAFESKNRQK